jgi:hypothetical protein
MEAVRAYQGINKETKDPQLWPAHSELAKPVPFSPDGTWEFVGDEEIMKQLARTRSIAVAKLKGGTNGFRTIIIFDEVNALVEATKLREQPFNLAKFDTSLIVGCRLVSGTPLHDYVETLSAGCSSLYVEEVAPFDPRRWSGGSPHRRVASCRAS